MSGIALNKFKNSIEENSKIIRRTVNAVRFQHLNDNLVRLNLGLQNQRNITQTCNAGNFTTLDWLLAIPRFLQQLRQILQ